MKTHVFIKEHFPWSKGEFIDLLNCNEEFINDCIKEKSTALLTVYDAKLTSLESQLESLRRENETFKEIKKGDQSAQIRLNYCITFLGDLSYNRSIPLEIRNKITKLLSNNKG